MMYKLIVDKYKVTLFQLFIALFYTFALYGVFIGQGLFSDVVTFHKYGDSLMITYPVFLELGDYLRKGILWGMDTGVFNGASDFYLRGQITTQYLPIFPFAYLSGYINPRTCYFLFFCFQCFVAMFYSQRIMTVFFKQTKEISALFAAMCLYVDAYTSWYIGHYIIATIIPVVVYYLLSYIMDAKKRYWGLLYSVPLVFCMTGGYLPLAVMTFVVCFFFAVVYVNCEARAKRIEAYKRSVIFFGVSIGAVLLYYLQIANYTLKIVQTGNTPIGISQQFYFLGCNLVNIISNSLKFSIPIENMNLISLGIIWSLFIVAFFKEQINVNEKSIVLFGVILNVLLLLICLGPQLPLASWFYSLAPILGSMHLPDRYFIVTLPFLYISLCLMLNQFLVNGHSAYYKKIVFVLLVIMGTIGLIPDNLLGNVLNKNSFIIEIFLAVIVFYLFVIYDKKTYIPILAFALCIVFQGSNAVSSFNNILAFRGEINESSIVYDEAKMEALNWFIRNNLESEKEAYRYWIFDPDNVGRRYVPDNLASFRKIDFKLINYAGHDPHVSQDRQYSNLFPWLADETPFGKDNIQYLMNTRLDFIIVNEAKMFKAPILCEILDKKTEPVDIGHGYKIYKVKKYNPSGFSDGITLTDNEFDNGYFYLRHSADDKIQFETDGSRKFNLKVSLTQNRRVEFLFWRNKHLRFYIDDNEIQPEIIDGATYLNIPSGSHEISVRYEHQKFVFSLIVLYGYYVCAAILIILLSVKSLYKKLVY